MVTVIVDLSLFVEVTVVVAFSQLVVVKVIVDGQLHKLVLERTACNCNKIVNTMSHTMQVVNPCIRVLSPRVGAIHEQILVTRFRNANIVENMMLELISCSTYE